MASPDLSYPPHQMLAHDLQLLRAPNPSAMTGPGTNTYVLGTHDVVVIDPGPAIGVHLSAILQAVPAGGRVSHILVTHSHLDHSALAPDLARETGAPVFGFGVSGSGRSAVMARLAARGAVLGGGEGADPSFCPDRMLRDGQRLRGQGWQLRAVWTPGHFGNHMCFVGGGRLFSGDHVMGWASSLVSPPDGDMGDYMASLRRLSRLRAGLCLPGHGAPFAQPRARILALMAHRQAREAEILAALGPNFVTLPDLCAQVYADVPTALQGAALRNLFAHVIDLHERGLIEPEGLLDPNTRFCRRLEPGALVSLSQAPDQS